MGPTVEAMRMLGVITQAGSFSAAARELGCATSLVSYQVRQLEASLGVRLFDRTGHRASLTPVGARLAEEARRVVDEVDGFARFAAELGGDWETDLRIVVDGALPLPPLLRALERLTREDVPTRLGLRVEYLGGVRARFERDRADWMAVIDWTGDPGLVAVPLPDVAMRLVARHDHPLHRAACTLNRDDLARHVELVVEDSQPDAPSGPGRLSLGSPHVFWLSDFTGKREALLAGVGFGWMPVHLVEADLAAGRLVPVDLDEGDTTTFHPRLVRRRGARAGRAGQRFVEAWAAEAGFTPPPQGTRRDRG